MASERSRRSRHSYVPFYMNDWAAAVAGMPRAVWSVLFQICQYNWDKVEPVPPGRLKIMVADLPNGDEIVNMLVEAGSLEVDPDKGIFSARAMREAENALALWEKKSRGGKSKGGGNSVDDSESDATLLQESSEESCSTHRADQDQDQDQDSKKEEKGDLIDSDFGRSVLPLGPADVAQAWNDMAAKHALKQIENMTIERQRKLAERMAEHTAEALVEGIKMIPDAPFLLGAGDRGWRASFDWFLRPDSLTQIVNGAYAPWSAGGRPATEPAKGPQSQDEADKINERLAEMGSTMRWRLEGKKWLLLPGTI